MNKIIAALLLTLLSAGAHADLIFEHDGHTYKLIESTATWEQAKNVAEKMTLGGHSGYLARIDSAAENRAIFEIVSGRLSSEQREATTPNDGSGIAFIWLGGSDAASEGDWRWLNKDVHGKFDAIVCLGNSFTHLHDESDRRRALAEFYAALKYDGVLILDQRNYDSILDNGFDSKHKYYYCGDQVTAEPEHMDDTLARFRYSFPDGSEFHLNMFPLRKAYVRTLMLETGFQTIKTFGDFQETYQENEPDFFVHVAEKKYDVE